MPLSQMFDKVFGMIKSDMYVIKLQEKERELSVLDTTNRQIRVICLRPQWGQVLERGYKKKKSRAKI